MKLTTAADVAKLLKLLRAMNAEQQLEVLRIIAGAKIVAAGSGK